MLLSQAPTQSGQQAGASPETSGQGGDATAERRANRWRAVAAELIVAEHRDRRYLARTLHDQLQQLLVASRLKISRLHRRVSQDLQERLAEVDGLINEAIGESRWLTMQLSPPRIDEGLMDGLEWLADSLAEKESLAVELVARANPDPLPEDVRLLVFQAIRELLLNIVQHAQTDHVRVELDRTPDGMLHVVVSDAGGGFDPARVEQSEASEEGLRLLGMCDRLALVDGQMEIASSVERGTSATLSVPCGPALESAAPKLFAVASQPSPAPKHAPSGKIRVLLADDHEILRQGLAGLLEEEPDIEVVGHASDGQVAVDLARSLLPDVVVMDVTMPRLNGVEATKRICAELAGVQVIGLSMHERAEMAVAMRKAGAVAFIPKDESSASLVIAIRSAVGSQKRAASSE